MKDIYKDLNNLKIGDFILYEYFNNDIGNNFKKWCLNTNKGYYNFYNKKELLSFIRELKGGLKE